MLRVLSVFSVGILLVSGMVYDSHAATIIVKQDGSGNATTINAAISQAAAGDIVEIADSQTYNEDVTVSKSITLRAATGSKPVIIATNTTPARGAWMLVYAAFGAPTSTPDDYGLYVTAPNVRLEGLTIRNTHAGQNPFSFSTSVSFEATGGTVVNCDIAGQVLAALAFSNIAAAGIASNNQFTVQNCRISEAQIGLAISDWNPTLGGPSDPVDNGTIEDCEFSGHADDAIRDEFVTNLTIQRCQIHDCPGDGISLEGGTIAVEDVDILNCGGAAFITDPDGGKGGGFITATIANALSCNNLTGFRGKDYNVTVSRSIFANQAGGVGFDLRPADSETQTPTTAIIDQCDVYYPDGSAVRVGEGETTSSIDFTINVKNSILRGGVVGADLLTLPPGDGSGSTIAFTNCDMISDEPFFTLPGLNLVQTATVLNVDPQYNNPTGCGDRINFKYNNTALASKGDQGQPIGSQGHTSPVHEFLLHN